MPNEEVEDLKVYEKDDNEMNETNEDERTNVEERGFWNKVECFIFSLS